MKFIKYSLLSIVAHIFVGFLLYTISHVNFPWVHHGSSNWGSGFHLIYGFIYFLGITPISVFTLVGLLFSSEEKDSFETINQKQKIFCLTICFTYLILGLLLFMIN